MVLIDTSVWITLFRRPPKLLLERLRLLIEKGDAAICGQTYVEFIGGFHEAKLRQQRSFEMQTYPWLETSREAHALAAEWMGKHQRLSAGDAIIAACALMNNCSVFTLDHDFVLLRAEGLVVDLY